MLFRCFDIYHDPVIHEAKRALPLLLSLVERVEQVLIEWPDYPVLLQVPSHLSIVMTLSVFLDKICL